MSLWRPDYACNAPLASRLAGRPWLGPVNFDRNCPSPPEAKSSQPGQAKPAKLSQPRQASQAKPCQRSQQSPVARQLLSAGCGLGEGRVALVHAKRSRAPLSTEKHTMSCFGTISFRSSSGPPLAQMPPKCLPDASQMRLRCLSDASQMPPDASQMPPDASPKKLFGVSRLGNEVLLALCATILPNWSYSPQTLMLRY